MAKKILKICSVVLTTLLAIIIIINVGCVIKKSITKKPAETFLGFGSAVVISGSMSPTIEVNDVVIILKTNNYKKGDVVMYYDGGKHSVTHRIVEVIVDENGNESYKTKGDYKDSSVDSGSRTKETIIGEVILVIPKAGSVQEFLTKPAGFLVVTLVAVMIIIVPDFFKKDKEDIEQK